METTCKTFKVTFFDEEMDVFSVNTYHNVINQGEFVQQVINKIDTLGLQKVVKCEADGRSYTKVLNEMIAYELN